MSYFATSANLPPWARDLPEGWRKDWLKWTVKLSTERPSDEEASDLPYISNEDIASWTGHLLSENPQPADADGRKFRPDDVLFNKLRPYLAKVHHANFSGISSGELLCMRPSEAVLPRYLFYVVASKTFVDAVNAETFGSKMPRADWEIVGHQPLPLPPVQTQKRISNYLDQETAHIDALIAKKRTLLDRLAEKRRSLIIGAVTNGLNPAVPMKPSGVSWLGDIPRHWQTYLIKRKYSVEYGVGGEIDRGLEEGTKLLSLPNISKDGRLLLDEVALSAERDPAYLLNKGDLLFNWRNGSTEHLGKTVLFNLPGDWTHVSFLLRIRGLEEHTCTAFLRYFLNGLRETGFFAYAKAGVNNTFNMFELRNLAIAAPPSRDEQEEIAAYLEESVSKLDAVRDAIEASVRHLTEYRAALVSSAITGKLGALR